MDILNEGRGIISGSLRNKVGDSAYSVLVALNIACSIFLLYDHIENAGADDSSLSQNYLNFRMFSLFVVIATLLVSSVLVASNLYGSYEHKTKFWVLLAVILASFWSVAYILYYKFNWVENGVNTTSQQDQWYEIALYWFVGVTVLLCLIELYSRFGGHSGYSPLMD